METLAAAAAPIDRQTVTSPLLIQASATGLSAGDKPASHPAPRPLTPKQATAPDKSSIRSQPIDDAEALQEQFNREYSQPENFDVFAAYAFPAILFAEGGFRTYPPAGITTTTYEELLKSHALSDDDKEFIKYNPVNKDTVVRYYNLYFNDALQGLHNAGGGLAALEVIKDFRARFAFADALFAAGKSKGAELIRKAIKKTLKQLHMTRWKNHETGTIKAGTLDEYRLLSENNLVQQLLIANLESLVEHYKLGDHHPFENRYTGNIHDFLGSS
jgi:hypothetical protein